MSAKREIMIDFFVRKLLLSSAKVCPDCSSAMQLEKKPIFMMAAGKNNSYIHVCSKLCIID